MQLGVNELFFKVLNQDTRIQYVITTVVIQYLRRVSSSIEYNSTYHSVQG